MFHSITKLIRIPAIVLAVNFTILEPAPVLAKDGPHQLALAPHTETGKRQARDIFLKRIHSLTRWLRRRNGPEIAIDAAERIARLYGLYRIDADEMLADLERLAARIERGEARMAEMTVTAQSFATSLIQIEKRQAQLEVAIAAHQAAISQLNNATSKLQVAAGQAEEKAATVQKRLAEAEISAQRAEQVAQAAKARLDRAMNPTRRYCGGKFRFRSNGRCVDMRLVAASD